MRARFQVQAATQAPNGVGELRLTSAGAEGNEDWAKGAAYGEMRLTLTNAEALGRFKVGDVVRFTLEPVEKKG